MNLFESWKKNNKGKGTLIYKDKESLDDTLSYLISSINKTGQTIRIVTLKPYLYENYIGMVDVINYDSTMYDNSNVFLLILTDVDEIYNDALFNVMAFNVHRYLFATAKNIDRIEKRFLEVAPIIEYVNDKKSFQITSSDIKIINVSLDMSESDQTIYDGYTNSINDVISYFDGDFDMLQKCYAGDGNTTADVFRRIFSTRNNWSDNMNTDIDYFKEVDKHYNPNAVYEKAKLYRDLVTKRNHFIYEHSDKCYFVNKFLRDNKLRTIVICQNNYMADKLKEFIDKYGFTVKAKAIHKDLSPVHFLNEKGEIIVYGKKSAKGGLPKEFGASVQTTNYIEAFNVGELNTLIITNAVNKGVMLKNVDLVIRLSDKSLTLEQLAERVNLRLRNNSVTMNIYFNGTKEDRDNAKLYSANKYDIRYYRKEDIDKITL